MRLAIISFVLAATAMPSLASAAEEIGNTSTGSITIRVVVPPLAAALQAQSEGAVGISSVVDTKTALMVNLPASISGERGATGAVYYGSDIPVSFVTQADSGVTLTRNRSERLNGMIRESFSVAPYSGDAASAARRANGITLIIKPV